MSGFSFVEWSDVFLLCASYCALFCSFARLRLHRKKNNLTHKTAVQCNVELYPDSVLILLFCIFVLGYVFVLF